MVAHPFHEQGADAPGRPAGGGLDVTAVEAGPAGGGQPQPGQGRGHAGAVEQRRADRGLHRHPAVGQFELRAQQGDVHPGQHRDLLRRGPGPHQLGHPVGAGRGGVVGLGHRQLAGLGLPPRPGPDLLGHPAAVVAQQVGGGLHRRGRAPVVDLQAVRARAGHEAGEVDQPGRGGAGEAVDGLVVVAHPVQVIGRGGQQPHQQQMGRGEVLELVHQQHPAGLLGGPAGLGVGQQRLDGGQDLLVVIDLAVGPQLPAVVVEHLREPLHLARERRLDLGRVPQPEPGRGEGVEPRGQPVRHGLAALAGDQAVEEIAGLGLGDGGHRPVPAMGPPEGPGAVHDGQGQAVEGADLQAGQIRGPLFHLGPGPHVEGHQGDRSGREAPLPQQVAGPLGENPGLARPGRGDDPGPAPAVGHRGELVWSQLRVRRVGPQPGQRPPLQGDGGQHRRAGRSRLLG